MFALLRFVRGIFGLIAGMQVLGLLPIFSWLQDPGAVTGNMMAIVLIKLLFMGLAFGTFFGSRVLINKLHLKRHGIPHPALEKKWAL